MSDIKQRVARQFSRAASHYDTFAEIQRPIADALWATLPDDLGTLLDIGCGTGRQAPLLLTKASRVIGVDIAEGMIAEANRLHGHDPRCSFSLADAEDLPFADGSFDAVYSSMALQWCPHLPKALSEIYRVLTPGGVARLGVVCHGSLHELSEAWQRVDAQQHVNDFLPAAHLLGAGQQAGFQCRLLEQDFVSYHPSLSALFKSLKGIGANVSTQGASKPLARDTLKRLSLAYTQAYGEGGALPLTYKMGFLLCQK